MEGAIDLIWNGRAVTIERRSQGRTPMGAFRAYETESGTPVPELTAENCGRTLCGAERSVFERTAFVRQLGMAVSSDAQLEQRLSALVTTGEEEQHRPLAFTVKELLGRHLGVKVAFEQEQVVDEGNVDHFTAIGVTGDDKTWSVLSHES